MSYNKFKNTQVYGKFQVVDYFSNDNPPILQEAAETTLNGHIIHNYQGRNNISIGNENTLVALQSDVNSKNNVVIGSDAMGVATISKNNVAIGKDSLHSNIDGIQHIAIGTNSMYYNQHGINSVAIGINSLRTNTSCNSMTAIGCGSLSSNIDSQNCVGIGLNSGENCLHGNDNTFLCTSSGFDNSSNTYHTSTAIGIYSKITANNQIMLGTSGETVVCPNKLQLNTSQTNSNGSVSGNILATMPFNGSSYKKVLIYCNSLNGTVSYTFPTSFIYTPVIVVDTYSLITSISTTSVSLNGSSQSCFIILEGF